MSEWWSGLDAVNQVFYAAAAFFSVLFVWQIIAAFIGLGGEEGGAEGADVEADAYVDVDAAADVDAGVEGDFDHPEAHHPGEAGVAFKLLSIRSIIAFFTLFTWGSALYLNIGLSTTLALAYGILWGAAGMLAVALIFYTMRRLTEVGTWRLATCVGTRGMVYLDIPPEGTGEARVTVSGVVAHVKARARGDGPIKAGTPVRVVRKLGSTLVEVEPVEEEPKE
jgi:membrane protein implicated in regulation of membrane protease activity